MVLENAEGESQSTGDKVYTFLPLLNAPNLDNVKEELQGTRNEPLADIVAAHPASMKDPILKQAIKMLDKREKIAQKVEA